jgi:acetolactate synthase-1/2/3 large subunit
MTTYEFTVNTPADIILVNLDPDIEKKGIYTTKTLYCDVKIFLEKMLNLISNKEFSENKKWENILNPVKAQWKFLLEQSAKYTKVPLSPGKVCDILSKMIPDDTIITVGAGMHLLYPMAFIPSRLPLTFLSAVNFGAMGFGFAAGLSAKLNFPERVVISILGDGDFLMTSQDLETAVREKIPLKILIINDNSYRVLAFRQKLQLQGRVYGSVHKNPDFVKFAESFGAKGIRIETPYEIEEKLKEMLESDIVTLVEVVSDPEDFPPLNMEASLKMSQ